MFQVWWLCNRWWESHCWCVQSGQWIPSFSSCWVWGSCYSPSHFPENPLWQVGKSWSSSGCVCVLSSPCGFGSFKDNSTSWPEVVKWSTHVSYIIRTCFLSGQFISIICDSYSTACMADWLMNKYWGNSYSMLNYTSKTCTRSLICFDKLEFM